MGGVWASAKLSVARRSLEFQAEASETKARLLSLEEMSGNWRKRKLTSEVLGGEESRSSGTL